MYKYSFDMEQILGRELIVPLMNAFTEVTGNVRTVPGKIGNGVQFYKDGGNVAFEAGLKSCLVSPEVCLHGFMIAFWLKAEELGQYSYYFSSKGVNIFSVGSHMHAKVNAGNKEWETKLDGLTAGKWHFVEVTWGTRERTGDISRSSYGDAADWPRHCAAVSKCGREFLHRAGERRTPSGVSLRYY